MWRMDGNPQSNDPVTLLAWSELPDSMYNNSTGRLLDWATLLVGVEQLGATGEEYNRIKVMYGDPRRIPLPATAMPLTRPAKARTADTDDPVLHWPPADIDNWEEANDYFTLIEWEADNLPGNATLGSEPIGGIDRYVNIETVTGELLFQSRRF
ncbi:MAG: hypothetical protein U5J62_09005 [Desulfurivibrio sp.]|nr:hypothetical protein [Desulfurivibrio sp.]